MCLKLRLLNIGYRFLLKQSCVHFISGPRFQIKIRSQDIIFKQQNGVQECKTQLVYTKKKKTLISNSDMQNLGQGHADGMHPLIVLDYLTKTQCSQSHFIPNITRADKIPLFLNDFSRKTNMKQSIKEFVLIALTKMD